VTSQTVVIAIDLQAMPFAREDALREIARLGAEPFDIHAHSDGRVFDPAAFAHIPDFMQRRNAMFEALMHMGRPDVAFFCDADENGCPAPLGDGINDLDGYVQRLSALGFCGIAVLRPVRGTDAMERSIRYLREKLAVYC
jgi:sugar phosphate isomerase/epimerase